jgi:hypothetical protein
MKKLLPVFLFTLTLGTTVYALDASEQRHVDMLTQGGNSSLKQASQEMFNSGETNPAVLDLVAESLLQQYSTATQGDIDSLSWAAKALGKSGNSRYHSTLAEVAEKSGDKKLRKYADQALDQVGEAKGAQYQRGMASLKGGSKAHGHSSTQEDTRKPAAGSKGLDAVTKGMSMSEAYALAGEPTSTTGHVTGKAWIPFNFRGADTSRQYSLYKGKGRIIFTNSSYYDHSWHVLEVQIDPKEGGYP